MGWQPDLPDVRDFNAASDSIKEVLAKSKPLKGAAKALPSSADLRQWCAPIEDQGDLGSCTANAGDGLIEYFERRAFRKHLDSSRLFLYKVTRNLLGWKGDTGAYLRDTMKALVMCGVAPERYWPYDIAKYDDEPSAFLYALGDNYEAVEYYRLDAANQGARRGLDRASRQGEQRRVAVQGARSLRVAAKRAMLFVAKPCRAAGPPSFRASGMTLFARNASYECSVNRP